MNPLQAVAFDLDGTLLGPHSKLTPRTKAVLDRLHRANIPIIVASGRPFSTIPEEVLTLDALRYVVTGNGVRIFDAHTKEDVHHSTLRAEALHGVLRVARYYPVGYEFFIAGKAFANRAFLNAPETKGVCGGDFSYLLRTRTPFDDVEAFVAAHSGDIDSMGLSIGNLELRAQLRARLEREVENIYVTASLPRLLEIADKDAGKASGVGFVLERMGIDAAGLAAFGDADNDLGMIQLAGLGVAMENGDAHLKEAADMIAPTNAEDGVAMVLEKILKENGID